jgi:two-component system LytT family response regulator
VDYLLKPIKISDLKETEERLVKIYESQKANREEKETYRSSLDTLMKNIASGSKVQKLTLYHSKGFNIVDVEKIVRLESDGNYTLIYLSNKTKLVVTRLLKDFEEVLDCDLFVRIHKSHIINLSYLQQYVFDDVGYAILENGEKVEISRRKASLLFEKITRLSLDMRKDK